MADTCMELVGVVFLRHKLFCCRILLFLGIRTLRLYGCLTFQIIIPDVPKNGVVCVLVELGCQ